MELKVYRSSWGAVGDGGPYGSVQEFLPLAKASGYDGVELAIVFHRGTGPTNAELGDLLQQHELALMPLLITFGRTIEAHRDDLRGQLEEAASFGVERCNAHAGADWFDDVQAAAFIRDAIAMAGDMGIELAFETHRGRILFEPWRTARLLEQIDQLRLTADLSHWVVVAERLLEDQADVLALACERTVHVHTRVGYEEGPQVPDPRLDRWQPHLEAHEAWWDAMWRAAAARGDAVTTLTPEWGPAPYASTSPVDGRQDVEIAPICDWMADRHRARFAAGTWR